jgi:hypothetical protein
VPADVLSLLCGRLSGACSVQCLRIGDGIAGAIHLDRRRCKSARRRRQRRRGRLTWRRCRQRTLRERRQRRIGCRTLQRGCRRRRDGLHDVGEAPVAFQRIDLCLAEVGLSQYVLGGGSVDGRLRIGAFQRVHAGRVQHRQQRRHQRRFADFAQGRQR